MKKIILMYLVMSALKVFGQQYVPFPTNAVWYQVEEFQSNPFDYKANNSSFTFVGDTIIRTTSYRKLFQIEQGLIKYIGGLRENSQKEIYIYEKSDSIERLLYKFGLSIGDSLKIRLNPSEKAIKIVSIDSIQIGNNFRKRYLMSTQTLGTKDYWIEGIGSTKGLFYTQKGGEFENTSTLFCFERNGSIEYRNTRAVSSCITPTNELVNIRFDVYPNPTSNLLNIQVLGLTADDLSVKIFDTVGNIIICKKVDKFDSVINISLDNMLNGIYFYEFSTDNGRKIGKFIIQK